MTEGRVQIETDVVFGVGGGRDLRCDVYTPPGGAERAPAVILVHGGAWRQGDRTQLRGYGILLGSEGYVCIAPEYRLTPEAPWPAQIHDVKAAIRWVRAHADRLGIDPERIAIEGNSAGAHLALLAAGTQDVAAFEGEGGNPGVSTHVAAALAIYPPTLFSAGPRERGAVPLLALTEEGDDEVARLAGPLSHVTADFPPTMLIHGTADETVPPLASIRMYEALVEAKVPVELHMYADQPHAFDAQPAFGRQCAAEMLLFLDRYLVPGNDESAAEVIAAVDAAPDVG
ncbi:alpha/beta hydrolase [Actinomarinicola tropica]|uniref:alpha/beta hydrolase n=1 Tax=Actinomarinicola tropica TaxID=2789776 RepID=UPI0018983C53|nr:alpha/beta hydrolase [Actinomarinicola tropica]